MKFDWENVTIEPYIQRRLDILEAIARGDETYRQMFEVYKELEESFHAVEAQIPAEQLDVILDYFGICDAMTHRVTELACEYMEFPQKNNG